MSIKSRIDAQRYRVSMNTKHLCIQSGDSQMIQLEDGRYREMPIEDITFHREGEHNESPWTRWYDMTKEKDAKAINLLREKVKENPQLENDINFRVRIVGEFEGHGEPWPGYDDQDAEQIIAYYKATPPNRRPALETMLQYEINRVGEVDGEEVSLTDNAKVIAIESLDQKQATEAKNTASAGVKM